MRPLIIPLLFLLAPLIVSGLLLQVLAAPATPSGSTVLGLRQGLDENAVRSPKSLPRRIVPLTLGTAEMVADLVPSDRVAAVTYLANRRGISNVPTAFASTPSLRGLNLEDLLRRKPDLLLVSRYTEPTAVSLLRRCRMPVVRVSEYETFADIRRNVLLLGKAVGRTNRASEIVRWMDRTLAVVRERLAGHDQPRERVLFFNGHFTAGYGTLTDGQLRLAGAVNLAARADIDGYGMISDEMVVALDPTVIVLTAPYSVNEDFVDPRKALLERTAWREVAAIRDGRIHVLPNEHLSTRSHYAVLAVVDLADVLHPRLMAGVRVPELPSLETTVKREAP